MTYNEFIEKFEKCNYRDYSIDTKGFCKHHIEPKAVQIRKYGKVINEECVIVSYSDHVRCHYYYFLENPNDIDEAYALSNMINIHIDNLVDISQEELEEILLSLKDYNYWTDENKEKQSETLKRYFSNEEARKRQSEIIKNSEKRKEIMSSDEYRQKMSSKMKDYYNNVEGARERVSENSKKQWKSPEFRKKVSASIKKATSTQEYKGRVSENVKAFFKSEESKETREKLGKATKERWEDEKYRKKVLSSMKVACNTEEHKKRCSEVSKECWSRKEYRDTISKAMKDKWAEEGYRSKMEEKRCKLHYKIQCPNGEIIEVNSLRKFCKETGIPKFKLEKEGYIILSKTPIKRNRKEDKDNEISEHNN